MAEDYHIHGGIVENVNCQGDVHMHGGVVEKMICQGECYQYGGIIEQRVIVAGSDAVAQQQTQQAKTRVIYKDRIVYRDKVVVQNNPQQAVIIQKLERENRELRESLESRAAPMPSDDVLVMRIRNLENELAMVKAAHKKEIEDLKDRLDVACEINAKLRQREDDTERRNQQIVDDHIDILATLMCLYPFTPDKDLEFEFNIPAYRIRYAAEALGAIKSPEARREAVDYLQRQHREMIERRGGDQGNHTYAKPIEKVSRNGRVVATYASMKEAVADNPHCADTIRTYCQQYGKKTRTYTKDGYTFRYKK